MCSSALVPTYKEYNCRLFFPRCEPRTAEQMGSPAIGSKAHSWFQTLTGKQLLPQRTSLWLEPLSRASKQAGCLGMLMAGEGTLAGRGMWHLIALGSWAGMQLL